MRNQVLLFASGAEALHAFTSLRAELRAEHPDMEIAGVVCDYEPVVKDIQRAMGCGPVYCLDTPDLRVLNEDIAYIFGADAIVLTGWNYPLNPWGRQVLYWNAASAILQGLELLEPA